MIRIVKLLLEGDTHKFGDFDKLRFDNMKTAKCMILMMYMTYA